MKDLGDRVIEAKVSMEMMKSSGPKIEPCGTPDVTAACGLEQPYKTTL